MIKIYNRFFKGYIREDKITAVMAEKESAESLKNDYGTWRVMVKVDGEEYIFQHYDSEEFARAAVENIVKSIDKNQER